MMHHYSKKLKIKWAGKQGYLLGKEEKCDQKETVMFYFLNWVVGRQVPYFLYFFILYIFLNVWNSNQKRKGLIFTQTYI